MNCGESFRWRCERGRSEKKIADFGKCVAAPPPLRRGRVMVADRASSEGVACEDFFYYFRRVHGSSVPETSLTALRIRVSDVSVSDR